jgi:hypothetical protein
MWWSTTLHNKTKAQSSMVIDFATPRNYANSFDDEKVQEIQQYLVTVRHNIRRKDWLDGVVAYGTIDCLSDCRRWFIDRWYDDLVPEHWFAPGVPGDASQQLRIFFAWVEATYSIARPQIFMTLDLQLGDTNHAYIGIHQASVRAQWDHWTDYTFVLPAEPPPRLPRGEKPPGPAHAKTPWPNDGLHAHHGDHPEHAKPHLALGPDDVRRPHRHRHGGAGGGADGRGVRDKTHKALSSHRDDLWDDDDDDGRFFVDDDDDDDVHYKNTYERL